VVPATFEVRIRGGVEELNARDKRIVEELRAGGADVTVYMKSPFDDPPTRWWEPQAEETCWHSVRNKIFGQEVWRLEIRKPPSKHTGLGLFENLVGRRNTKPINLAPLAGLKNLQVLWIYGLNDIDLPTLDGLTKLRELRITGAATVRDYSPLAALKNLRTLYLAGSNVTDLTPLAELKGLQQLKLASTNVSDLKPLAGLDNLETLDLHRTRVRDLAPLAGLKKLKELDLWGTPVRDLTPLSELTSLQKLELHHTQVSDVTPLAGLKNLQWVWLGGSRVDAKQRNALQQSLPNCQVIR
jgi:Leucine-rich repeat (LRR) protein